MVNVVFTGVYRNNPRITNLSLKQRIDRIRQNGVDNIFWYTWKNQSNVEVVNAGVKVIEIDEPYPHVRGIGGRQRQIYNIKSALQDFDEDDIILKLRWDLDFTDDLLININTSGYLEEIEDGIIKNKIWTGFYSVRELFSPADKTFAGYQRDLNKLINFQYLIDGVSSNNYISHDGMMLMPVFIEKNSDVCNLIRLSAPNPESLVYQDFHREDPNYLLAWSYSYYIFHKYFKTGPLGTCYFKRGDQARWPTSIVNYSSFQYNYDTMVGKAPMLGLYPRYRVYDDLLESVKKNEKFIDNNVWRYYLCYKCHPCWID